MSDLRIGISTSSFGSVDDKALSLLRSTGADVVLNPYRRRLTEDEAAEFLADKVGLLAGLEPLTRRVIESAGQLRAICRVGIGISNVDLDAVSERGIKFARTPEAPTEAVAEMTVAALLALCRNIVPMNADLHGGTWNKRLGRGLAGSRVLIVGFGRIGRRTAELLAAFGCAIAVADPAIEAGDLPAGYQLVELANGVASADVVSLHASGTSAIVMAEVLGKFRPGAILLNSARGELVDEAAVVAALDDDILGGVWFDAFAEEPYRGPLAGKDRVLLSPHCATYTSGCRSAMELRAAENLVRDLGLKSPA